MEETIQCLPQELRTLHPKRWSTENVSAWVTGWGFSFSAAGGTLLQNGVDGRTIHDALSDTSQSPVGDVTSLQGEQIHKHVYVIVAYPLSSHLCPNSGNTSKTKETGQKRKRYCFSDVQTTFLEAQLKDGTMDSPEDR